MSRYDKSFKLIFTANQTLLSTNKITARNRTKLYSRYVVYVVYLLSGRWSDIPLSGWCKGLNRASVSPTSRW